MDALVSNVDVMTTSNATSAKATAAKVALTKPALEKTAKDFEAVFMAQMLKPMWEGLGTNEMFGGGAGEDVMKDLLVQEYGKAMVRKDQHGLSPAIMDAMIRMQGQSSAAAATAVRG